MGENNGIIKHENTEQSMLMRAGDVKMRLDLVTELYKTVMVKGIKGDYGVIPGTGDKPTLLKPGAEKLCMLFRLAPTYDRVLTDMGNNHREYSIACTLTHIPTGVVWGQGLGSASTMESKYRWRGGARLCPDCGKPAIKKSKYPPRGAPNAAPGYYCFAKVGGCGVEFAANNPRIVNQSEERQENPDIADTYNTVLKMAMKRALVGAVIVATGASALFTQDLDDTGSVDVDDETPAQVPAPTRNVKPAAAPAPAAQEFEDRIVNIDEKSFQRKPKDGKAQPDGVFWLITTHNKTVLSTFSKTLMEAAENAMAEDVPVAIQWSQDGQYKKLIEIFQAAENRVHEGELVNGQA